MELKKKNIFKKNSIWKSDMEQVLVFIDVLNSINAQH